MSTRTSIWAASSSAGQLFLQPLRDLRGYQVIDVAAERGELLDSAGRQETVLRARHQVHRLYIRGLPAVQLVHLQLVLEVRGRPPSLYDRPGPVGVRGG